MGPRAKHAGGRPPIINDLVKLEKDCSDYLNKCIESGERPLLSELALKLGFVDKQSVYDYINRDNEFSGPLKKVKYYQEIWLEKHMAKTKDVEGNMLATPGIIFALKNCGWSDNKKIEHSTGNLDTLKRVADDVKKIKEY